MFTGVLIVQAELTSRLTDPEGVSEGNAKIDLVAVHGTGLSNGRENSARFPPIVISTGPATEVSPAGGDGWPSSTPGCVGPSPLERTVKALRRVRRAAQHLPG
jgi:hypothetical protein